MLSNNSSCFEIENTLEIQSLIAARYRLYLGALLLVLVFSALVLLGNNVYANLDSELDPGHAPPPTSTTDTDRAALEAEPHEFWKPYKVAHGENLSRIFKRMNVDANQLAAIMRADPLAKRLRRLKPGQMIKLRYLDEEFAGLEYVAGPTYSLFALRDGDSFTFSENQKPYDVETQRASVTIHSSLFMDAKMAGISERTTMNIAKLFGWDVDFALDIRDGDSIAIVYQTLNYHGKKIKDGDILAAEFTNQGKVYRAVKYTDPDGVSGYYNPQGENMHKPFLRTPVDFTRISSHFGSRYHPVLHTMRKHNGVDYAAPRGTTVRAAGDGKILYQGTLRGYGNTVIIDHGAGYRTLYAHLQGYNKHQRMGSQVKQGQTIGYVGSSGMATGPHLHYEFLVNSEHRNPLTIALPTANPLNPKYLADFQQKTQSYLAMLPGITSNIVALNSVTK